MLLFSHASKHSNILMAFPSDVHFDAKSMCSQPNYGPGTRNYSEE